MAPLWGGGIVLAYYSAVKVQAARIIDTPVNIISASIDAEGSDNFRIPSFLGWKAGVDCTYGK